ncbi:LacI family DNA-binding transcriptional regulator [Planococcus sp. APC 4015]|nr:LacI family DNA-binding transcriptional regulator [Planococcus sp. APC 4015]
MPAPRRVTLSQIAGQAGVSLTTISKVLNGGPDVAAPTRARIEDLLQRSGYERRRGEHRDAAIEVVLAELDGHWSLGVIDGVSEAAARRSLAVTLSVTGDVGGPDEDWARAVLRRRPAGVVLLYRGIPAAVRDELRSRGIPFVVIDPAGDPAPGVPSIGTADWSGGVSAARHLGELGHRRIAVIAADDPSLRFRARLDGFAAGIAETGSTLEPDVIRRTGPTPESAAGATYALLELAPRPTAVFAVSDMRAFGVIAAARSRGMTVPTDLSVVGFDDVDVARLSLPPLTTVHLPLRELGERAVALALGTDTGADAPAWDLATSLIVRDSTAAPPGDPRG